MVEMSPLPVRTAHRRCFLFAAYSPNNKIDSVDLFHLESLKRFGDVYIYMDNDDFSSDQMERVAMNATHVLSGAHGEYDFGSWKRLILYIGWETLETYDEVIFINNSVMLVGDLTHLVSVATESNAQFFAPVFVDEHYNGPPLNFKDYFILKNVFYESAMFSSFYWVLKNQLIREPFFRDFILGIKQQPTRLDVCYEYERGFTRSLLRHGVSTAVLIDRVFKMSFIYTEDAFRLTQMGLPYLKRKVLSQDYYKIPFLQSRIRGLLQQVSPDVAEILKCQLPKFANDHEGE